MWSTLDNAVYEIPSITTVLPERSVDFVEKDFHQVLKYVVIEA